MIHDHAHSQFQPDRREFRVDATFKTIARIGIDFQRAARVGDLHRIPIGAFDEHIHRVLGAAGVQTTHDTRDAFGAVVIRNDHLTRLQRVGFFIERNDFLAAFGTVHTQIAGDLVRVKNVQRAVAIVGEKVGDIDQETDRAQANGAQRVLQPNGAWTVRDTLDHATTKHRATVQRVLVDRDANVGPERRLDHINAAGFQLAQTTGCQIARDALNAQRVGAVWRDRDVDNGVDFGRIVRRQPVHKPVANLARGQFDDAVVFL